MYVPVLECTRVRTRVWYCNTNNVDSEPGRAWRGFPGFVHVYWYQVGKWYSIFNIAIIYLWFIGIASHSTTCSPDTRCTRVLEYTRVLQYVSVHECNGTRVHSMSLSAKCYRADAYSSTHLEDVCSSDNRHSSSAKQVHRKANVHITKQNSHKKNAERTNIGYSFSSDTTTGVYWYWEVRVGTHMYSHNIASSMKTCKL